jgi:predicted dehydrogenase
MNAVGKLARFARIYGLPRTLFKALGRTRTRARLPGRSRARDIAFIGCGQYAFATIGYFLWRRVGNRIGKCYDVDPGAAETLARFYSAEPVTAVSEIMDDPAIRYVYIASNHASHTDYAIEALACGKTVYVEKPVSVTHEQLARLRGAVEQSGARLYCGYNRPFSAAIRQIRKWYEPVEGPLTLSCFITGHRISSDHWYRRPSEGTRICGNVGHWLDLAVHIMSWGRLPDRWQIALAWSQEDARDDDLCIALTSNRGDLVTIVLTARDEPFEGINESINLQAGSMIAKIDDFRKVQIWKGSSYRHYRTWPKDVGHAQAIVQPFCPGQRSWKEVEMSSLLMLHIKEMVENACRCSEFSFSEAQDRIMGTAPSTAAATS